MRWFALIALAGCGRLDFDPRGTDAGPADTSSDGCTLGAWQPPQPLASLNTTSTEYSPALSSDGLTIVFQSNRPGGTGAFDLWMATRPTAADPFGAPTNMAQLNSPSQDFAPTIRFNGLTMYFVSDRSSPFQLYQTTRTVTTDPFGPPSLVNELASTMVAGPTVTADGSEMFFGGTKLYRAVFSPSSGFTVVGVVSELPNAGYPTLSGDGLTIYYVATGPPTVWMATRPDSFSAFGVPVEVVELLTNGTADDPEIAFDGRSMVLVADSGAGNSDLFISTRACGP